MNVKLYKNALEAVGMLRYLPDWSIGSVCTDVLKTDNMVYVDYQVVFVEESNTWNIWLAD